MSGTKRPIVLVANGDLKTDKLKAVADLIVNIEPGGASREWVLEHIGEATALLIRGHYMIDAEFLDRAKNLKYLVTISVGHENIDLEECKKRGLRVGYAGGILTEGTAEMCVALTLAIARRIPEAAESARKRSPTRRSAFFGMGRIGESVAEKLLPFHPRRILYHNRRKKTNVDYEYVSFEELLKQSDFLLITTSAGPETEGVFNRETFKLMKTDSILVNISRGKIIRTDDLVDALLVGTIGAAALDVTDPEPLPDGHPLYSMANCIVTPHIGSGNTKTRQMQLEMGEENVLQALPRQRDALPVGLTSLLVVYACK
ncbi:Glyoxylate reductase/hydroxypyruvate reductase [Aphelenchoides fujianensis]|nr:Glyoxylate reductase/hydroxypyruvate reductase [Aphelenchoides fujianensis]